MPWKYLSFTAGRRNYATQMQTKKLDWSIDSAGTGKWHLGAAPDKRSVDVAAKQGIDISGQRARSINSSDYEEFDLIFAMDISNYKDLMRWAFDKEEENKIKLIMDEVYPMKTSAFRILISIITDFRLFLICWIKLAIKS